MIVIGQQPTVDTAHTDLVLSPVGTAPQDLVDAGRDRYFVTASPADDLDALEGLASR